MYIKLMDIWQCYISWAIYQFSYNIFQWCSEIYRGDNRFIDRSHRFGRMLSVGQGETNQRKQKFLKLFINGQN